MRPLHQQHNVTKDPIMSSEEERLYARAEMLEDLAEPASAVSEVLAGAQGAGVDPRAVISLTAALQTLDPGASTSYTAGSRKDRQDGSGYGSDGEFLEALSNAEDQVREHLREVKALQEQAALALDRAERDLGQARRDLEAARAALAAAYAMSTKEPCNGCHGAKAAAIAAAEAATAEAEARIRDAERRIALCETAADLLGPLTERLARALTQLRTVPQDLGEVYELIHEFVRSGGKLPRYARWIEGANA
jgi:mono/diheme cytochrome c family protein